MSDNKMDMREAFITGAHVVIKTYQDSVDCGGDYIPLIPQINRDLGIYYRSFIELHGNLKIPGENRTLENIAIYPDTSKGLGVKFIIVPIFKKEM